MVVVRRSVFILGGVLAAMAHAAGRAEEIYTAGPETLTASVAQILTGPISEYSMRILSASEPPGPDAIPLKWIVTGRVDNPSPLKGEVQRAIAFSRAETSMFISDEIDVPSWELDYGDLQQSGQVVLFMGGGPSNPVIQAIPSGTGEADLASLVRDIVAIQANPGTELDAWLAYLSSARQDHGREAALRSLVKMKANWKRTQPVLESLVANPSLSQPLRMFVFGVVAFGLTSRAWDRDQLPVADFLCRQFETARAAESSLRYILTLKLVLNYAMEEAAREARAPLRERIVDSLRRSEPLLARTPALAEQYRQIRASYPGLL